MGQICNELYKALIQKYESDILSCKTTLMIYFENPVGIGDHTKHLEDMDELISRASSSNDKIKMLKLMFKNQYGSKL